MDKSKGEQKGRWSWLPAAMPEVARLIGEKKQLHGAAHVAKCWEQGVTEKQPGWLFAREGALSIGTPPQNDPELLALAFSDLFVTQAFLYIREPEQNHGQG